MPSLKQYHGEKRKNKARDLCLINHNQFFLFKKVNK